MSYSNGGYISNDTPQLFDLLKNFPLIKLFELGPSYFNMELFVQAFCFATIRL